MKTYTGNITYRVKLHKPLWAYLWHWMSDYYRSLDNRRVHTRNKREWGNEALNCIRSNAHSHRVQPHHSSVEAWMFLFISTWATRHMCVISLNVWCVLGPTSVDVYDQQLRICIQAVHLTVARSPVTIENCGWRPKTIWMVAHLASETICYLNSMSVAH